MNASVQESDEILYRRRKIVTIGFLPRDKGVLAFAWTSNCSITGYEFKNSRHEPRSSPEFRVTLISRHTWLLPVSFLLPG